MSRASVFLLCAVLLLAFGCETIDKASEDLGIGNIGIDNILPAARVDRLRLEANKPGTAFCLGGKPLVAGDPGLTVQAGDRVYIVEPAPKGEEVTVIAAQPGFFVFVDSTTPNKRFLQFDFFERHRCRKPSQGRTCTQADVVSDLAAFERFCSSFP